ncbi:MAG: GFA family protein [Acidobacteria bacterium]|nr:GFA family protein [Acidobacteriota bacterium]MCB9399721.1 GFA family protein [Acidobacteriota bacterium]
MSEDYFGPESLQLEADLNRQTYQFGDHMVEHFFCAVCGVYVFHQATAQPGHFRINLACLDGLDLFGLKVRHVDGRAL